LKPGRRWENNIKMHLTEIDEKCVEWINLAPDMDECWAVVNKVISVKWG
jgi:hypothetical protein